MDVIVVTGASSGIGRATADLLSSTYSVVGTARKDKDLEDLASNGIISHYLDLRSHESVNNFVSWIEERGYQIRALVNNAGVIYMAPILAQPEEQWYDLMEVNVFGQLRLIKALLPNLIENKAQIINISSDSGLVTFPYTTMYCMSKYAVESLTDGLAEELREFGVTVHAIEPGNFATPILETSSNHIPQPESVPEVLREQFIKIVLHLQQGISMQKMARRPKIVAETVQKCIEDTKPYQRYIVAKNSELSHVINELLDRVAEINHTSGTGFTQKELIEKFKFALDAVESN